MRRFIVVLFSILSALGLYAQSGNVKDVRQTYLWDVTLSMQGKAPGAPDIWDEVKAAIISDIMAISNDRTEIVVVPFQHKALDEWRETATAAGKAKLIAKIKSYKIPRFNFNGRMTTQTCLYEPLQYVVDNVLSEDKVDILKLMTDGIPDEHKHEYEELLQRWCFIAKEKDAYGFYIMLTSQAAEGRIVMDNVRPCRFDVVDVTDLESVNVSPLVLTPQRCISINIKDDFGKDIRISFSRSDAGEYQPGYKVHVYSHANEYLKVDQVVELKDDYTLVVTPEYLMSYEAMHKALPVDENLTVFLQAEPSEGMDELPFAMTRILDSPTALELINKLEKTVRFYVQ